MSIAKTNERRGVSAEIGSLLPSLACLDGNALALALPESSDDETDQERWADLIETRLAALPASPDAAKGKAIRDRIFRAASFLAEQGTVSHASTRCQWRNLVALLKLTACDADFWSPTGPVIGVCDARVQERTGQQNTRRLFKQLQEHGLVIPWCAKTNGRRHWRRRRDGTVEAAGWSLAPLIFVIDAIELLVDEERERIRLRIELPQEITAALQGIRKLISRGRLPEPMAADAALRAAELTKERDNAKKGRLERLVHAAATAEALFTTLKVAAAVPECEPMREESCPVQRDESVPAHTNDHSRSYSVDGLAEGRSGDGVTPSSTSSDRFGIERSGFEWRETPHLFPFTSGIVEIVPSDLRRSTFSIGRVLQIQANTIDRAIRTIGLDATTICLLLTGQHHADGQIRRTCEIYFRGLMARAREDNLNIGHSLFGRREQTGSHRERALPSQCKRSRNHSHL